jgi:hypothetical protein
MRVDYRGSPTTRRDIYDRQVQAFIDDAIDANRGTDSKRFTRENLMSCLRLSTTL